MNPILAACIHTHTRSYLHLDTPFHSFAYTHPVLPSITHTNTHRHTHYPPQSHIQALEPEELAASSGFRVHAQLGRSVRDKGTDETECRLTPDLGSWALGARQWKLGVAGIDWPIDNLAQTPFPIGLSYSIMFPCMLSYFISSPRHVSLKKSTFWLCFCASTLIT
ncbi:unnamed protein product [Protopolystoma xenopodis]|uniref:Uncharacterized protein n=1 Tax=Protopolystoma xenopodis TaxID=117903 RepID=A0A3S5BRS6_9PLAT|nr:unnamed protein product [Protopolystoma xenopodis]